MKQTLLTLCCALSMMFSNIINTQADNGSVMFLPDVTSGCAPFSVTFANTSTIDTNNVEFFWYVNGQFIQNSYHFDYYFQYAGRYNVSLMASGPDGPYNVTSTEITVDGNPGYFNCSVDTSACIGENVMVGIDDQQSWISIKWDFGDGYISNNNKWDSHQYAAPGNYTITLVFQTHCGYDTIEKDIHVWDGSTASVHAQSNGSTVCPGDIISFSMQSNDFANFAWDFGDGTTSTLRSPIHVFDSLGDYDVILTAENRCGDINTDTIFVVVTDSNNAPTANFWFNNSSVCPGSSLQFNCSSPGTYYWNFGDGMVSTLAQPQHIYPDTGTYLVTLIVTSGCGQADTNSNYVTIEYHPELIPNVNISFKDMPDNIDTLTLCMNETVRFDNKTDDWNNSTLSYLWNFDNGDTSIATEPSYNYSEPGFYEISMIATNSCGGSDTAFLWVDVQDSALPVASLFSLPDTVCPGEYVFFFNNSNPNLEKGYVYNVWYGDGDSSVNITTFAMPEIQVLALHNYDTAGVYHSVFTVTNLCGQTLTRDHDIVVDTTGLFTPFYYIRNSTLTEGGDTSSAHAGCPGDSVEFMGLGGVSYEWHFGDGSPTQSGNMLYHTYDTTGYYNAYVVVLTGCGRHDTIPCPAYIDTTAVPQVGFDISNSRFCSGDTLTTSIYNERPGYSYYWVFGDGTSSTEATPQHVYAQAGNYTLQLIVSNGCGTSMSTKEIEVKSPQVSFTTESQEYVYTSPILFQNTSDAATDFYWEFGNGAVSTEISPVYVYPVSGTYTVTLTGINTIGCTGSYSSEISIVVPDTAAILLSDFSDITCHGLNNGFIDISVIGGTPPFTYIWSNAATTADLTDLTSGVYSLTVTDHNGIHSYASYQVLEPAVLSVNGNISNVSCHGGNNGSVYAEVSGGTAPYTYNWSNNEHSDKIFDLTAGYYILTLTDQNACALIDTFHVTEPNGLTITIGTHDANCGVSDGKAWIEDVTGGSIDSLVWKSTPVQSTDTAFTLETGVYEVDIYYNGKFCIQTEEFAINNIGGPTIDSLITTDISCNGGNDGGAVVYASDGTYPYTYQWSITAPDDSVITDLTAGNYFVGVIDAGNCATIGEFTINQPSAIEISAHATGISCDGTCDGVIDFNVTGGTPPYTYLFNNAATGLTEIIDLCPGVDTISVTDANGCSSYTYIIVPGASAITLDLAVGNESCDSSQDGSINLSVSGGISPYTYLWSNAQVTQDIEGLYGGTYIVTVTDANGCISVDSAQISTGNCTGIHHLVNDPVIKLYPNPATSSVTYTYNMPDAINGFEVRISDFSGRTIRSYHIENDFGQLNIDLSDLAEGVYLCGTFMNDQQAVIKKLVVIR